MFLGSALTCEPKAVAEPVGRPTFEARTLLNSFFAHVSFGLEFTMLDVQESDGACPMQALLTGKPFGLFLDRGILSDEEHHLG